MREGTISLMVICTEKQKRISKFPHVLQCGKWVISRIFFCMLCYDMLGYDMTNENQ